MQNVLKNMMGVKFHITSCCVWAPEAPIWSPKNSTFFKSGQICKVDWNWFDTHIFDNHVMWFKLWFSWGSWCFELGFVQKYREMYILNLHFIKIQKNKMHAKNSNLPCKFGHFCTEKKKNCTQKNWSFGCPKRPFGVMIAQTQYDLKFYFHL